MALSYSFGTRITSGFVKGTVTADPATIMRYLSHCSVPVAHPLLLPLLILRSVVSRQADEHQRGLREKLRRLESALSQRYKDRIKGPGAVTDENLWELDGINRDLTDCHCQVLSKRPQAWQNVVSGLLHAAAGFWEKFPDPEKEPLEKLQETLLSRLDFLRIKLEGMENYTHVSLERLNLQREVVSASRCYPSRKRANNPKDAQHPRPEGV